jgi:hypothetical protein
VLPSGATLILNFPQKLRILWIEENLKKIQKNNTNSELGIRNLKHGHTHVTLVAK